MCQKRERKTERLQIRIEPSQKAKIIAICKRKQMSVNEWIGAKIKAAK